MHYLRSIIRPAPAPWGLMYSYLTCASLRVLSSVLWHSQFTLLLCVGVHDNRERLAAATAEVKALSPSSPAASPKPLSLAVRHATCRVLAVMCASLMCSYSTSLQLSQHSDLSQQVAKSYCDGYPSASPFLYLYLYPWHAAECAASLRRARLRAARARARARHPRRLPALLICTLRAHGLSWALRTTTPPAIVPELAPWMLVLLLSASCIPCLTLLLHPSLNGVQCSSIERPFVIAIIVLYTFYNTYIHSYSIICICFCTVVSILVHSTRWFLQNLL